LSILVESYLYVESPIVSKSDQVNFKSFCPSEFPLIVSVRVALLVACDIVTSTPLVLYPECIVNETVPAVTDIGPNPAFIVYVPESEVIDASIYLFLLSESTAFIVVALLQ
jgi:hypothetical protein